MVRADPQTNGIQVLFRTREVVHIRLLGGIPVLSAKVHEKMVDRSIGVTRPSLSTGREWAEDILSFQHGERHVVGYPNLAVVRLEPRVASTLTEFRVQLGAT